MAPGASVSGDEGGHPPAPGPFLEDSAIVGKVPDVCAAHEAAPPVGHGRRHPRAPPLVGGRGQDVPEEGGDNAAISGRRGPQRGAGRNGDEPRDEVLLRIVIRGRAEGGRPESAVREPRAAEPQRRAKLPPQPAPGRPFEIPMGDEVGPAGVAAKARLNVLRDDRQDEGGAVPIDRGKEAPSKLGEAAIRRALIDRRKTMLLRAGRVRAGERERDKERSDLRDALSRRPAPSGAALRAR